MKTAFSTSLLAAALLAGAATAADQAPAVKPAPGPVLDAVLSALREQQLAQDPRLPLPAQLDSVAAMRYTPETAAKLRAVFGNEQPLTVTRQSARPGRLSYQARLQPLHYAGDAGSRVDWDEALLDLDMDQAGKTVDFKGGWRLASAEEAQVRMSVEGISLSGHYSRSPDLLWFGSGQLHADGMRVEPRLEGAPAFTMNDLGFGWRMVERPKAVDMHVQYRIGGIEAAGQKVEDVRFDMRLVNIDRASMVALQAAGERQRQQQRQQLSEHATPMTPEQEAAAMKPLLLGFAKAAIVRGSSLEIDEISARYHGNKASIRGRIGLAGAVEADLQDVGKLLKKIVARFEIRVPVAIVRDITGVVATRQGAQPAMGQTMADVVVGKLVGSGFARIENDVLISNLEFRNGKLTANGKEIGLPKIAPNGQPPVAAQRSNLPPNALQARRIEDSCRLPDFPDEVVGPDKALTAGFAWRVNETGKVENVRVTASSGYPAWDRSMIEVLGQCRYIPALQDGKAIGLNVDWSVTRLKGGPRSPIPVP